MIAAVRSASRLAADVLQLRGTTRVGITGLARSGKTALLTSLAANLLALSAGRLALPALSERLRGRKLSVAIAPAEASGIPRFEVEPHTAALAADPPRWPERTTAVSLLALDVDVPREGLLAPLALQRQRSNSWTTQVSGFSISLCWVKTSQTGQRQPCAGWRH